MKKISAISAGFIITILLLFFYSYTQVDLGLTLSRVSLWQYIQKYFQYIGYFQRPLSTTLYIILVLCLFTFYGIFLFLAGKNALKKSLLWKIVLIISGVLLFSYSAFSYDIFNYIFDAKIITHYFQNPYTHSALDFPLDPMLSFMHWTQRTYPYGPMWLIITIPVSFIGSQIFLFTFFLFKAIGVVSYLATVYYIQKILDKVSPKETVFGMILFALNPLVIIESLTSAHLDIAMMAFALMSIYYLLNNKNIRSIILFILSIAIKFATIFLIPLYLFLFYSFLNKRKINAYMLFLFSAIFMILAVVIESVRTNFQPWYPLIIFPFLSLLGKKEYVVITLFITSFFFLLEYVPFLYTGNWNPPIPTILNLLTLSGLLLSILVSLFFTVYKHVLLKR